MLPKIEDNRILDVDKEMIKDDVYTAIKENRKDIVQKIFDNEIPLINLDKKNDNSLFDKTGQSLYYHVVKNLSPEMCKTALDQLQIIDHSERTDKMYLYALEPNNDECKESALMCLVDKKRYELMDHPVIDRLVTLKWRILPLSICCVELAINLICCISWILFAALKPFEQWYIYDFRTDVDRTRVACLIVGLLFSSTWFVEEIVDMCVDYSFKKKHQSENKLSDDNVPTESSFVETDIHDKNKNEEFVKIVIKKEDQSENSNKKTKITSECSFVGLKTTAANYFFDPLNWFDWLCIFNVYLAFWVHIGNICDQKKETAKIHLELVCATIPILCVRPLKQLQCMFKNVGLLIITLALSVKAILAWFCLYIFFWIPFTVTNWIVYGDVKFNENMTNVSLCNDPNNLPNSSVYNCSVVEIEDFSTFERTLHSILISTLGQEIDSENKRDLINETFTLVLIAVFAIVFSAILLNLFIAVVDNSFSEAKDKKVAFFNMERAKRIVFYEKLSKYLRVPLRSVIRSMGSPYVDDNYSDPRFSENSSSSPISYVFDIKNQMQKINNTMKIKTNIQNVSNKTEIINELSKLKELLVKFKEIKCICTCKCRVNLNIYPVKVNPKEETPVQADTAGETPVQADTDEETPIQTDHDEDTPIQTDHDEDTPIQTDHDEETSIQSDSNEEISDEENSNTTISLATINLIPRAESGDDEIPKPKPKPKPKSKPKPKPKAKAKPKPKPKPIPKAKPKTILKRKGKPKILDLFGYNGRSGYRRNTPDIRNLPNIYVPDLLEFWKQNG